MTRKERLQAELEMLERQQNDLVRKGKLIQSMRLNESIEKKKKEIADCEYYEYKPLAEIIGRDVLTKNKVYSRLLEISLAADYLADCAVECKYILNKLGIGHLKIIEDIDIIRRHAHKLSALPCKEEYNELYDLMMDNDGLVKDIHTLTRHYMRTKLKAKEYQV